MQWIEVSGIVQEGHQIASGRAENTPYDGGSIQLQTPFFQELGLDLSNFFSGTINLSIAPNQFQLVKPFWQAQNLRWTDQHPPETFSFFQVKINREGKVYEGLIYYPHPETKQTHFQDANTLEILAPRIAGLKYGDRLLIELLSSEIQIVTSES